RDVRGTARRDGQPRARPRRGAPSLHAGAAALDSRARAARRAPLRDPRQRSVGRRVALRLSLPSPLSPHLPAVPPHRPGLAGPSRRPARALPRRRERRGVVSAAATRADVDAATRAEVDSPTRADVAPILRVEGLRTWFPVRAGILQRPAAWVRAVDDVSFEIETGRTLALVGESGSGKQTVG